MTHAQNIWKWKESLTTEVIFNVSPDVEHISGNWIARDDMWVFEVIFINVRLGILEPSSDFQRQPGCTFILVIFISKRLEDINYRLG